ncbi:MAG: ATP-binding protein [Actinobacteria bacterium]|nr:ATP-binding protein [Actinomycetota bacterium]
MKSSPANSIYIKILASFILMVFLIIALTTVVLGISVNRQFNTYLQKGFALRTFGLASSIASSYLSTGSWEDAQKIIENYAQTFGGNYAITDANEVIVASTIAGLLGGDESQLSASGFNSTEILDNGQKIAILYVNAGIMGMHTGNTMMNLGQNRMGQMMNQLIAPSQLEIKLADLEQNFLKAIRRVLIVIGLLSALLATGISLYISNLIINPIKKMTKVVKKMASGDLTQRVKYSSVDELGVLASSFNEMADDLQRSENSRRELIADIAHEFRTPLTSIKGYIESIKDGIKKPDPQTLGRVLDETDRLTSLISDLQQLSLAESGNINLEKETVDLNNLLKTSLAKFEIEIMKKKISARLDLQKNIPPINLDKKRISQVFENLISNAIKYNKKNGIIDIISNFDKSGAKIVFSDSGIGIPSNEIPFIFDRFYRSEKSRSRKTGGTGLGLSIAKNYIELHGGSIKVESVEGKGTTFTVFLPSSN